MKGNEWISMKIQHLYNDLDLLEQGHFKEHDPVPGSPSYSTLAKRMRESLDTIVKELKKEFE